MDKMSAVICFPCVLERTAYLLCTALIPSRLCLCLDVWQMEGMGGGQSENTP
jgi:hypothetical protein